MPWPKVSKTDNGFGRVIVLYRSLSQPVEEFLNFFSHWLEGIEQSNCTTIITGDFNINLKSSSDLVRRTKDVFHLRGYKQLVKFNTRVSKTSTSLIDFVLTNAPAVAVSRLKTKISDHETI
jgi:endonuclease/exonuclease/phosphatase family metal-dependent hydrolase